MNNYKAFEKGLDILFRLYTEKLRRETGKKSKGPKPKMDRRHLKRGIERLVLIVRDAKLNTNGRMTFDEAVGEKRQWHKK
jgi:hypothetical protein